MKSSFYIIVCILLLHFTRVTAQQLSNSNALSYSGKTNFIIENKIFTSGTNGVSILLTNCSGVKIRNCVFKNTPSSISIQLSNCNDIQIQGCSFDSIKSGVYAINCTGGLVISCNSFKDIIGPKPRGQMVQFNACTGAGNRINNNILEQTTGVGAPEDLVNLYASSGTVADPIQVSGNKTRGGGPSTSGGGFMLGDNGSHDIIADNNILVNPGQYGIAAPSGQNITISNNSLYAAFQSFTNVGLYVGLQSEIDAGYACVGNTIKITSNKVNWKNKNNVQNDIYVCPCCPGVVSTGNTTKAAITAAVLPTILKLDNSCASLNLNCSVLGTACPVITESDNEVLEQENNALALIQNNILIAHSDHQMTWQLLDLQGNVLKKIENNTSLELDMKPYNDGIYVLISTSFKIKRVQKIYYTNN